MTTKLVRKQVYLTQNQVDSLTDDARQIGISMAEMLRRVLDERYAQPTTMPVKRAVIDDDCYDTVK